MLGGGYIGQPEIQFKFHPPLNRIKIPKLTSQHGCLFEFVISPVNGWEQNEFLNL